MTTASSVIGAAIRVNLTKARTLTPGARGEQLFDMRRPDTTTSLGRSCDLRERSADRWPSNVKDNGQVIPGLRRWL